ncbi:MAG: hypothetical protein DWI58_07185 [Chloroflexi bacterium]|nr:MAG: hypothetical protein DWI58_07185 [Chloroflexota bacterium]
MGGMNRAYVAPSYQDHLTQNVGRAIPDVSFNADPSTGFAVYTIGQDSKTRWQVVGGTSAGAPQWAAMIAIADQFRAVPLSGEAFEPQNALYAAGNIAMFDVIDGRNGPCDKCTAGVGFDFATGLGSPRPGIIEVLVGSSTPAVAQR